MFTLAPLARQTLAAVWFFGFLLCAGSVHAASSVDPRQGPKIMVPPILGIARSTSLKSHYVIVRALRQRFGARVVDDTELLQAQKKLHIWPRKLRRPQGVAALAQAVGAERALIISATRRGVSVAVYVDVNKPPTRVIKIRKIRARRVGKKQARRIARVIARKATLLLSAEPFPRLTAISPKVGKKSAGGQTATTHDGDSSWDAIDVQVGDSPQVPDAESEIREEEQREQRLQKILNQNKNRQLSMFLVAGAALSTRRLKVSGSQAAWVIPVQAGLLPYLSLSGAVFPLHFVPTLKNTAYKDLSLRVSYQRAVYRSLYQGEEIAIDDDKMHVRLSYSQPLLPWNKTPSLGLGLGYGWQRAEVQSAAALLSSRYTYVELFSQLKQPLWKDLLDFRALLSARQPFASSAGLRPVPSWSAELCLTAKVQPWWFARLGVRAQGFSAWRGAQLQVDEQDRVVQFELGGFY